MARRHCPGRERRKYSAFWYRLWKRWKLSVSKKRLAGGRRREKYVLTSYVRWCFRTIAAIVENETRCDHLRLAGNV